MLSIGVEKHVYLLITPRPSSCMGVWALKIEYIHSSGLCSFALTNKDTEPISGLCNSNICVSKNILAAVVTSQASKSCTVQR